MKPVQRGTKRENAQQERHPRPPARPSGRRRAMARSGMNVGHGWTCDRYIMYAYACSARFAHLIYVQGEYHNESRYHKKLHFERQFSPPARPVSFRTSTDTPSATDRHCRIIHYVGRSRDAVGRSVGQSLQSDGFGADDFSVSHSRRSCSPSLPGSQPSARPAAVPEPQTAVATPPPLHRWCPHCLIECQVG